MCILRAVSRLQVIGRASCKIVTVQQLLTVVLKMFSEFGKCESLS